MAPAPATAQLTGNVKSVDTDANRLIVKETGTGTEYAIAVTGQTLVVTTAGKPLTLKDLRKGDGLAVTQSGALPRRSWRSRPGWWASSNRSMPRRRSWS